MQGAEWARLSHPFTPEAIGWYVVEYSEDRSQVRLAPYLNTPALISRLDEVCGRHNWSFQLAPLGAQALVCNLSVGGVGRSAVASASTLAGRPEDELAAGAAVPEPLVVAQPGRAAVADAYVLAAVALSNCAALFGMPVPAAAAGDDWVDFDAEAGVPLYTPQLATQEANVAAHDGRAAPRPDVPVEAAGSLAGEPYDPESAPADERRPDGHQVIDRLLERLKAEGLGREAARLVVAHNGYGRTAEESRVLYGKLRSLLVDRKPVAP